MNNHNYLHMLVQFCKHFLQFVKNLRFYYYCYYYLNILHIRGPNKSPKACLTGDLVLRCCNCCQQNQNKQEKEKQYDMIAEDQWTFQTQQESRIDSLSFPHIQRHSLIAKDCWYGLAGSTDIQANSDYLNLDCRKSTHCHLPSFYPGYLLSLNDMTIPQYLFASCH